MGRHFVAVPPKRERCPPSGDCAPKKATGSVPLECSLGSETPKILIVNPVFVGKNCLCAEFVMKTFYYWSSPQGSYNYAHMSRRKVFFWSSLSNSRKNGFLPLKTYLCLPSHATLPPKSVIITSRH